MASGGEGGEDWAAGGGEGGSARSGSTGSSCEGASGPTAAGSASRMRRVGDTPSRASPSMVSGSISRDCGLFAEDGSDSSAAPGRCASAAGGATRCACANSGDDDGLGDASGAALADGAADASPGSGAASAMGAGAKGGRGAIAEPSSSTCVSGLRASQRAHRACAASGRIHPACTAAFRSAQATFTAGTVLRAAPGSAAGVACACACTCARASASFLRRTPSGVWTVSNGVSACQLRPTLGRAKGSSGRPAAVGLARSGGGTAMRLKSSGVKRPERLGGCWAGATPSNAPNSARLGSGPRRAPAGLGAPAEPGVEAPGVRPPADAPAGVGAPGAAAGPGASGAAETGRGGRLEKMEGFQLEAMLRCSGRAA
jgi:hypothetical protein